MKSKVISFTVEAARIWGIRSNKKTFEETIFIVYANAHLLKQSFNIMVILPLFVVGHKNYMDNILLSLLLFIYYIYICFRPYRMMDDVDDLICHYSLLLANKK